MIKRHIKKYNKCLALLLFITVFISACGIVPSEPSSSQVPLSTTVDFTLRSEAEKPVEPEYKVLLENYKKQNEDVIALLKIPDTLLEYPLMYREGEEEYYLRKDINGKYNIGGLPFMQQGCSLYENNVFVYGHYFKTGEMFGCLHNYINNEEYYKLHPDILLQTPAGEQKWRIFAVSVMPIEEDSFVYNDSNYKKFDSVAEFDTYMSYVEKNNTVNTDESVKYGDRILFLSTCYDYNGSSQRVVAFAKLL